MTNRLLDIDGIFAVPRRAGVLRKWVESEYRSRQIVQQWVSKFGDAVVEVAQLDGFFPHRWDQ